ncbi:MAG TPA: BrnT family toxin [Terriglobales bacterium]
MKLKFEWDRAKAQANCKKHGVSFEVAQEVFGDPFAILRVVRKQQITRRAICDYRGPRRAKCCRLLRTANE